MVREKAGEFVQGMMAERDTLPQGRVRKASKTLLQGTLLLGMEVGNTLLQGTLLQGMEVGNTLLQGTLLQGVVEGKTEKGARRERKPTAAETTASKVLFTVVAATLPGQRLKPQQVEGPRGKAPKPPCHIPISWGWE